jgi:hypothetical protein
VDILYGNLKAVETTNLRYLDLLGKALNLQKGKMKNDFPNYMTKFSLTIPSEAAKNASTREMKKRSLSVSL